MASVRRRNSPDVPKGSDPSPGQALPVRWVVIGILSLAAGVVGYLAGGPVAAITTAVAVAVGAHRIIA